MPPDPRRETFRLAADYRPGEGAVLFVAESPPQKNRRGRWSHFYPPEEKPPGEDASTLFWALAEVLALPESCGMTYAQAFRARTTTKRALLAEFTDEASGWWTRRSARSRCGRRRTAQDRGRALRRALAVARERVLELEHVVLVKATGAGPARADADALGFRPRLLGERIPTPGRGSGRTSAWRCGG